MVATNKAGGTKAIEMKGSSKHTNGDLKLGKVKV